MQKNSHCIVKGQSKKTHAYLWTMFAGEIEKITDKFKVIDVEG